MALHVILILINATFHQVTHETSLVFTVDTAKSKNNNIAAIIHLSAKTQKKAVMTVARGVFEKELEYNKYSTSIKNSYINGRCVEIMKSGLEFLYTNLEDVCNHCHFCSLVYNRYAIIPLAPVFSTEM